MGMRREEVRRVRVGDVMLVHAICHIRFKTSFTLYPSHTDPFCCTKNHSHNISH